METFQSDYQSLKITSLNLQGFRNYRSLSLNHLGDLSIFIGKNAVGKTSIIEAIELMTELKSFRSHKTVQLINWNQEESYIQMELSNGSRHLQETLHLIEGQKKYFINEKSKSIKELKGLLPAVIFTPDDLDLVKGSHSKRRDSLDNLGVQISKNFYSVRNDYLKLLKQKNQALKDEMSLSFIQSLNDVLIKVGVQYILHRFALLQTFCPYFEQSYKHITNSEEKIRLDYVFSWGKDSISNYSQFNKNVLHDQFAEALSQIINDEYSARKSLIGPHADHIEFYINQDNTSWQSAHIYASQGQQRSVVLAFKMAELETIQHVIKQKPVLLLDDVMSELDENRRRMFMNLIRGEIQTFITTTHLEYFENDILEGATIYSLPFESTDS